MKKSAVALTEALLPIAQALQANSFTPHPMFKGRHAQTLAGYFYPRRLNLRSQLRRDEGRLFEVDSDVQLLAHCRWQPIEKRRKSPTLLLVHGLEGSSDSVYMLGTAAKAYKAGFNVLRLNLRTCGNTEHLTCKPYHSGMSHDLQAVINELINSDKLENIFLGGFSLGGNMSLKLAGEWSANTPKELRGVVAISPSIDLAASAKAIEHPSNQLYNRRFIKSLKKRVRRIQKLYPELYNFDRLNSIRSIRDFDSRFTAVYGGFKDVDDYYARASALSLIKEIHVPTLIIQAQDDPFIPFESFRHPSIAENPFVLMLTSSHGGHVGFISAAQNEDRFWAENRLVEFCRLLSDEKTNASAQRHEDAEKNKPRI